MRKDDLPIDAALIIKQMMPNKIVLKEVAVR